MSMNWHEIPSLVLSFLWLNKKFPRPVLSMAWQEIPESCLLYGLTRNSRVLSFAYDLTRNSLVLSCLWLHKKFPRLVFRLWPDKKFPSLGLSMNWQAYSPGCWSGHIHILHKILQDMVEESSEPWLDLVLITLTSSGERGKGPRRRGGRRK